MKIFNKKLDLITLFAIVIMAISVSTFNFDNLSWNSNSMSYLGILIFSVLIVVNFIINKNAKNTLDNK